MDRAQQRFWSHDFVYFTHTPTLQAQKVLLYPLETGLFSMKAGHETERNTYPSFEIMYVRGGSMRVRTDSTQDVAHDGDFILLDCYAYHRYEAIEPLDLLWLHFDGVSARYYFDEIRKNHGNVINIEQAEKILAPMQAIYDMFKSGQYLSEILAAEYLTSMLTVLALSDAGDITRRYDVQKVMTYIVNHPQEALDVKQLAAMTGMTERSFIRVFKKESGYTPHAYVISVRMNLAKKLLANSKASLQEVCDMCGYSQPAVFCSAFKAQVGVSPMEYRQSTAV